MTQTIEEKVGEQRIIETSLGNYVVLKKEDGKILCECTKCFSQLYFEDTPKHYLEYHKK